MALALTTSVERLNALLISAASSTGLPVELDRPHPYKAPNLPLVLISSGDLRADAQSARTWSRHWVYSPAVEIVVEGDTPAVCQAALNAALGAFIDALEAALTANERDPMADPLLTQGAHPEMMVTPFEVQANSRIRGYLIELELPLTR